MFRLPLFVDFRNAYAHNTNMTFYTNTEDDRMNRELRQMVGEALAFGDVLDEAGLGVARQGREEKTAQFLRLDMVKFLLFLSVSDDTITPQEAQFFRDYLGYNFESETIASLVEKFELTHETFETTIPFSLGVLLDTDCYILSKSGRNPGSAMALLRVYHALGSAFVCCDETIDEQERRDFSTYLSMLQQTIQDKTAQAQAQYDATAAQAAASSDAPNDANSEQQ